MTMARPKIVNAAWQMLPEPLRGKLRGNTGKRFVRFVPVSLAAVAASQVTLAVLVGITKVSAGTSAIIASMVGAAVSYVLSRWAWERKGKAASIPGDGLSVPVWPMDGKRTAATAEAFTAASRGPEAVVLPTASVWRCWRWLGRSFWIAL